MFTIKYDISAYWFLSRPSHFVKNSIVFVPLLFKPTLEASCDVAVAFVCFCLAASGVYALNDVVDRKQDSQQEKKKNRPVASGRISPLSATMFAFFSWVLATGIAARLSPEIATIISIYIVSSTVYSLVGKDVPLLDISLVAFGFVLRTMAGLQITDQNHAMYGITLPVFFASLALATGKRFAKQEGRDDQNESFRIPKFYTPQRLLALALMFSHISVFSIELRDFKINTISNFFVIGRNSILIITVLSVFILSRAMYLMINNYEEPVNIFRRDAFTLTCVSLSAFVILLNLVISSPML